MFSPDQVQHAFAAEGLFLHLAGPDQQTSTRTSFAGPHGLSVLVFESRGPNAFAIGWTGIRPTTSGRGNVVAIWTPSTSGQTTRVRNALNWLGALPPR